MKCSLINSNFLEEMSSLSHSVLFLYFFALITEESFLISSCYSLEFCIQMEGTNKTLCSPGPRRKEQWLHKRLSQTCLWVPRSLVEAWVGNREGTQPCPSKENWIKDLVSMVPPIRTKPSFPHSQSLPTGSFHKPLILLHQRADRMKTTITDN